MSKGQNILLPPNLPIFVFPFTLMSTFLHHINSFREYLSIHIIVTNMVNIQKMFIT